MINHLNVNPEAPKRVIVLGGSGFIGKKLCASLSNNITIDSKSLDLTKVHASYELAHKIQPTDTVVFLSALGPNRGNSNNNFIDNILMADTVIRAIQKSSCQHLIYISSEAVYGIHQADIDIDTKPAPDTVYGAMHLSRELLLTNELQNSVPLLILRLSQVYGDGCTHNAYGPSRFIKSAVNDKKIDIFGNGEDARDFVHIDDVIAVILHALQHRSIGVANVASGYSVQYRELADFIADKYRDIIIESQPRKMPAMQRTINISELKQAYEKLQFKTVYEAIT